MTLVLGMSKREGIYLSADYRVTDLRSGRLVDDASVKHLTVHYPPEGGPKVLFAYSGLAVLPDGAPTGRWLRETLRGESEFIDQSMAHLRDRLDRDVAPAKVPLVVNALVLEGDRRLFGGLSNLRRDGRVVDSFGYVMNELDGPFWFANGSGAAAVIADERFELLRRQLDVRPRKPLDHMRLFVFHQPPRLCQGADRQPLLPRLVHKADERTSLPRKPSSSPAKKCRSRCLSCSSGLISQTLCGGLSKLPRRSSGEIPLPSNLRPPPTRISADALDFIAWASVPGMTPDRALTGRAPGSSGKISRCFSLITPRETVVRG